MKLALLLLAGCFTACALPESALAEICFDKQMGDSYRLGESLIADQKYLAVGDPGANRVTVYRRTTTQRWIKFRTILPPKNSSIDKIGNGFGYSLALTEGTLVIGAYASKQNPQDQERILYPFQPLGHNGLAYTGAIYSTSIGSNTPLKRIDRSLARELSGFSIVADAGKIAFGVLGHNNQNQISKYTILLSGNNRRAIDAGGEIALHKNRLVVGKNIDKQQGHISIFNLKSPELLPEIIRVPIQGISAIELTDKFLIISEQKYLISTSKETSEAKILVFDLLSRTSNLFAGPGNISAHENLFVSSHPTTGDSEIPGRISLFDLSATPPKMLSTSRLNIRQSFLTKNFLFKTVNLSTSGGNDVRICIAPQN
jgi:hypothetical protein